MGKWSWWRDSRGNMVFGTKDWHVTKAGCVVGIALIVFVILSALVSAITGL